MPRPCLPLVILLLLARTAAATEALPIIVTYEMKRRSDAERVERRDPKAFWIRQIVARIEDGTPVESFALARPATALVAFTVARDGHLLSQSMARSSGIPAVDRAATDMVQRAQPFPPMPAAMTEVGLSFSLPLRFR